MVAVLVLQRRVGSGAWEDAYTFYNHAGAIVRPPEKRNADKVPVIDKRPAVPEGPKIEPRPTGPGADPNIVVPQEPGAKPRPKTGPPFDAPKTTVPGLAFEGAALKLAAGTTAIRAVARRADGSSIESAAVKLEVRKAPDVLTILAMGGTCTDPDANTTWKNLEEAGITRDKDACAAKGVSPTFLGDLTSMSSVNCNDPCNPGCVNFFEHLALRIMNDRNLADSFDSINDPGTKLCAQGANAKGIRNHIIFGKWRNTEEERVCGTPVKFNTIIDDFVSRGGKSVIMIGQSQGGAKLAGMVRDHWRWGNNLTLELLTLWDATSFDVPNGFDTGHFGVVSMGVRKVGDRPKKVLNFCQYSNAVPFQNGSPLDRSEHHDDLEEHDLDGCFSHNGIARSQFVHHRTAEVVEEALVGVRDRARR
jgi:hypothetical protein